MPLDGGLKLLSDRLLLTCRMLDLIIVFMMQLACWIVPAYPASGDDHNTDEAWVANDVVMQGQITSCIRHLIEKCSVLINPDPDEYSENRQRNTDC